MKARVLEIATAIVTKREELARLERELDQILAGVSPAPVPPPASSAPGNDELMSAVVNATKGGTKARQIASDLGLSLTRVYELIGEARQQGLLPTAVVLAADVLALTKKGLTPPEIADELNVPRKLIDTAIWRARKKGLLPAKDSEDAGAAEESVPPTVEITAPASPKPAPFVAHFPRRARGDLMPKVVAAAGRGLGPKAIAAELGISLDHVYNVMSVARKQGRLPKAPSGEAPPEPAELPKGPPERVWRGGLLERTVAATKEGLPLLTIAAELGMSASQTEGLIAVARQRGLLPEASP